MLDINLIRTNPEKVKKGVRAKNIEPKLVDDFLSLDDLWRKTVKETDDLKAKQKKLSNERKIDEAKKIKIKIQDKETDLKSIEKKREEILYLLPNLPLEEVPAGKNEKENVVLREVGKKPKFSAKGGFQPKNYLEIAEKLDLIDIERAAKVSGSRFGYLKNQAALLEFALIKLAFDKLISKKFIPIIPPVMVKNEMMKGMGYVDSEKDAEERYFLEKDNLYLVGTSEQSIGPMHADETFKKEELPKRYLAFSACFRREAGAHSKDVKGLIRVHEFYKLEQLILCKASHEESVKFHEELNRNIEEFIESLEVPYRQVAICTGDLKGAHVKSYDTELWVPKEGKYREIGSASYYHDFQTRRFGIRYKDKTGKILYAHSLNATAIPTPRILVSLVENYQRADGSIKIPEVLRKYMGGKEFIN